MATSNQETNMSQLLGPNGQPISRTIEHTKGTPNALGPAFGAWAGRDITWASMPGGSILGFDLSRLTLADYRAMHFDPQINACISVLTFMLHQVDFHFESEVKKQADVVDECFRPAWTRLVRGLSQSFWAGYSPNVLEFDNDVNKQRVILSKVKDLIPEECKVHWKEVEGNWAPPGKSPMKLKIYDGIDQQGTPWPIPPESTLGYPLLMQNGDYYGRKLLKSAFAP